MAHGKNFASILGETVGRAGIGLLVLGMATAALAEPPNAEDLRNRLLFEVPPVWSIPSLEVEATQNFGSEVEPIYRSRFRATARVDDDTFEFYDYLDNAMALLPVYQAGHTVTLYGFSTAELYRGIWDIRFEFQGSPFANAGEPRSAFTGPVVIVGSEEYETLLAAYEERQRLYNEEQARLSAEAEAARQESERAYAARAAAHFGSLDSLLGSGTPLDGLHVGPDGARTVSTPFRMEFSAYDPASGRFQGRMTWQSGAVLSVEGLSSSEKLSFAETGWIANPRNLGPTFFRYDGRIAPTGISGIACAQAGLAADLDSDCTGNASFTLSLPR